MGGESLTELPTILSQAGDAGFTDVWTGEGAQTDAFTPLVMAAATRPEFRLGTAIASAFVRSPTLLTLSAAGLADIGSAEVLVGIGTSSEVMVRDWHGVAFDRPYQRVRDVLRFMKRALTGEKVSFSSESFDINGFRLARVPNRQPKLLLAALRSQMLTLAGREADGVIVNWLGAGDVPTVARYVLDAKPDAEIVGRIFVIIADDDEQARAYARRQVTAYLNVGVYAEFQRWLGRGEILAPMWREWSAGRRQAAVDAVPDSLVDEFFLYGSPERIRAGIDDYLAGGLTTPVLAVTDLTGDAGRGFLPGLVRR